MSSQVYEDLAREKKVSAIVCLLIEHRYKVDGDEGVESFGRKQWALVAKAARVNVPGSESKAAILQRLRDHYANNTRPSDIIKEWEQLPPAEEGA